MSCLNVLDYVDAIVEEDFIEQLGRDDEVCDLEAPSACPARDVDSGSGGADDW